MSSGRTEAHQVRPARRARRVLAFIAAHPDDDVMGVAGIVARHRDDPEFRFVLAHATDGGAGEIAPGSGATRRTLGAVRREEDARGWAAIGRAPDLHEWWDHEDGGLDRLGLSELDQQVTELLERERPDVVLSFGPDGITGHPDHVAVGAATTSAFVRLASSGSGPGLRRLYHGAYPRSAFDRENARRVTTGKPAWDPSRMYEPRPVDDDLIACTVDQRAVVPLIRAAFAEHRTQWAPPWTELDERGWLAAAGENHLVQAWPPWRRGTPRLMDPFDGL